MSDSHNMPNRRKWTGWVIFTWVIAAASGIAALVIIASFGYIEVPRTTSSGYVLSTAKEPNWLVWSVGIGQAVGAVLLAVLFSMVNSIYKGLFDVAKGEPPSSSVSLQKQRCVKILSVNKDSPLHGRVSPGWRLHRINGSDVYQHSHIAKNLVIGQNAIDFYDDEENLQRVTVSLDEPPSLGVVVQ